MSRAFAIAAVVLTMCAGLSVESAAQTSRPASPDSIQNWRMVEGRVAAVSGRWIVLANGIQLAVPDNVNVIERQEVKPGDFVRVMYEDRAGQKFATSVQLRHPLADPE
jgi:hypothetical protein